MNIIFPHFLNIKFVYTILRSLEYRDVSFILGPRAKDERLLNFKEYIFWAQKNLRPGRLPSLPLLIDGHAGNHYYISFC